MRWKELPRLRDLGVVAPLLLPLSGVFLGDDSETLRVDGGGIRLESLLLRRWRLNDCAGSGVVDFFGEAKIVSCVALSCGTFSLSSYTC